ncbi:MAG: ShlB/FhaC/HecB family hemolysin secretion/activation protein [Bacillota bacterium]|nr:ShlB/FhaC/HecB family hemolysin secretion/activation protein [Bacillota bacterium]
MSVVGTLLLVITMSSCGVLDADSAEIRFYVDEIVTDPSEILSPEEIEGILGPLEGRELSVSELMEAVEALDALYGSKGYVTAKALLPPQDVEGGVVYIQLVEGRLGQMVFSGNEHTVDRFFQDRISLKPGDLIRLDRLEEDILYFNQTNDVTLHGQLSPGEEFGTTDITVIVEEAPWGQIALFADNAGRSEAGRFRTGISMVHSSLLGLRDPLSISATKGKGSLSGTISYNLPINTKGFRVGVRFDGSSAAIISGEFESLEIEGRTLGRTVYLSSPLRVEAGWLVDGFLEYSWYTSRSIFSGTELIKNETGAVAAGFNSQKQTSSGLISNYHSVTMGNGQAAVDKNFVKYNGSFGWMKSNAEGNQANFKAMVQLSPSRLLPPEQQFALGGMNSVRGFEEGLLTGDSGYLLSFEYSFPVAKGLGGFLFFDHGGALPFKGNEEPISREDFLTSTGVGLDIQVGDHFYGRLQAGIPLMNKKAMDLHLAVQLSF